MITLTQTLAAKGYSHRAPTNPNHNGRVILNGCGTAIGRLTASEGWLWLELGCPLDINGFIDADDLAEAQVAHEESSCKPYAVSLGPTVLSHHAIFADALNAYRKVAHHNHAHVGNWVAADVDFDGLTDEEKEAVEAAHAEAKRALAPKVIDLFEALKRSLEEK